MPNNNNSNAGQQLPKTALAISLILQSMGVEDTEPRVIHQLMDFLHRTGADFLDTATALAEHRQQDSSAAAVNNVTVDDLKLAIQSRHLTGLREFQGPPSRETVAELAQAVNEEPLPIISERFGLRLPAERFCLTQPNYKVSAVSFDDDIISMDTGK